MVTAVQVAKPPPKDDADEEEGGGGAVIIVVVVLVVLAVVGLVVWKFVRRPCPQAVPALAPSLRPLGRARSSPPPQGEPAPSQ